ncbi:hypothetical protein INR49_019403 [Caranx melampygus]|nr:hypothetical protein INR49_019403 [Caranx melampygus]
MFQYESRWSFAEVTRHTLKEETHRRAERSDSEHAVTGSDHITEEQTRSDQRIFIHPPWGSRGGGSEHTMTHGRRLAAHRSVTGTKSRSRDLDIQRVDLFAIGSRLDVLVLQRREAAFIRPDDLMLICSSCDKQL